MANYNFWSTTWEISPTTIPPKFLRLESSNVILSQHCWLEWHLQWMRIMIWIGCNLCHQRAARQFVFPKVFFSRRQDDIQFLCWTLLNEIRCGCVWFRNYVLWFLGSFLEGVLVGVEIASGSLLFRTLSMKSSKATLDNTMMWVICLASLPLWEPYCMSFHCHLTIFRLIQAPPCTRRRWWRRRSG